MEELSVKNVTKYFKISDKQKKALGLSENKKLAVNDVSFTAHSEKKSGLWVQTVQEKQQR